MSLIKSHHYTVIAPSGRVYRYSKLGWSAAWYIVYFLGLVTGLIVGNYV